MALEVGGGSDSSRSIRNTPVAQETPPATAAKKAETATPAATANPVEKTAASKATVAGARAAFQNSGAGLQNALNAPGDAPPGNTPTEPGQPNPEAPGEEA